MQRHYIVYLVKNLAWPTLLVAASLTGIIWLTQALRFIDFIVNRGLSLWDFVHITSLLFPTLLLLITPMAFFVGILYAYHKLTAESELVVLQAAGLSYWQLAAPALAVGAVCVTFCYMLSLYVMPLSNRQFNDMRSFLRDNYTSVLLQEEVFTSPVDGLTVFVRSRKSDGQLKGILVHDGRDPDNAITMMADEGRLMQTPAGPQFYLQKGLRQEIRKGGRISWLNFDSYVLDINYYTGIVGKRDRDSDELYLGELLNTATAKPSEIPQRLAEAHQRLVWPVYNIVLCLFGLVVMLTGQFNRRGRWKRLVVGSVGAILLLMAAMGLRNLVVKHSVLLPIMYAVPMICMGLCAAYLTTPNMFRRRHLAPVT